MVNYSIGDQQKNQINLISKNQNKIPWKNIEWKDHGKINFLSSNMLENEFKAIKSQESTLTMFKNENEKSFHEVIYPVIFLAQVFALMPVYNIRSKTAKDLKFNWCSIKFLYSVTITISIFIMILVTIYWLFDNQIEFGKIVSLAFYGSSFTCIYNFTKLSRKWPNLMVYWENVEKKLPTFKTETEQNFLGKQIKWITFTIMSLAFIEHTLSIVSGIFRAYHCVGITNPVERYFRQSFPQLFYFTNYSLLKSIFCQFLNLFCTFFWNFSDLFIIVISVALTTRLKQINYSLRIAEGKVVPVAFWETHRIYYQHFTELLIYVDSSIDVIILLSFAINLYFVCIQLLNSLKPLDNVVHAIYFWYSLIFLILRTLAVSLYSSKIHDESRLPLTIIQRVPKEGWCEEVQRFCNQALNDKIALSGKKFFHLTRKLILKIAGTIVTYELVLIQFNTADEKVNDKNPCT